jgi:peptide deformylase
VAKLEIVLWPAKVLETKAEKVTEFDDQLRQLVSDMHETMQTSNGIGLAANQVGVLKRIVTMEIPWSGDRYEEPESSKEDWHDRKFTFINPVVLKKAGKTKYQEGCLSFPDIFDFVDRSDQVWIKAQDEFGVEFEIRATGLLSICIQHEIDHIDGIVFINRMSPLKRELIKKKISKRGFLNMSPDET